MTNSQRLSTVREHLLAWLQIQDAENEPGAKIQDFVPDDEDSPLLTESILIVDGFYAGRTFHGSGYRATWFMEPDELKIHVIGGGVVAVFQGDAICEVRPEPVVCDVESELESEGVAEPEAETESPISIPMSEGFPATQPNVAAESEEVPYPNADEDSDDSSDAMPKAA